MRQHEPFESNGELDITTADHVLYLEVEKLGLEAKLLNDSRVLSRRQPRIFLALRAGANHLARAEDEGGRARLSNSHDDGRESLGIVFGVPGVEGYLL